MRDCVGCTAGLASFALQWGTVALVVVIVLAAAWVIRELWRFDGDGE